MAKRKRKTAYRDPGGKAPGSARVGSSAGESPVRDERTAGAPRGTAARRRKRSAVKRPRPAKPAPPVKKRHKPPENVEPFTFEEVKRERRRRRRKTPSGKLGEAVYRILMFSMIAAAIAFIASVFFEVKNVEVVGSTEYPASYVAEASGIVAGDRLLFINKFEISENLFSRLPYVKEVKVRHRFPDTVVIELTERQPAAKLVNGGISYIVDEEAYLLEYTALGDSFRLPVINGMNPIEVQPGTQMTFEDPLMIDSLKAVLSEIVSSAWIENITEIDMERIYDITFYYGTRYTVLLGDTSELEYKLAVFEEVLSRLRDTDQGVIDLSSPEKVPFQPYTT